MPRSAAGKASARWHRRKEARPGEIMGAALACFAERGFAATRLDDVAERAGVTKGTLYLYFPNKEELFKAVVRQALVPNIARGEALVAESGEPASVLLERLLYQWSEMMATPASAIPKLMLAEAGNFPDLARFYLDEVVHRGMGLFGRLLRSGIARGEFRAVDIDHTIRCMVAPIILGMLWRHSFERHEQRSLDAKALCRTQVELLLHGLEPRAGSAASPLAADRAGNRRREADR